MDTFEFMQRIGVKRAGDISKLIKLEIINPVKIGKVYNYTETDAELVLEYFETLTQNPKNWKLSQVVDNLNRLTEKVETCESELEKVKSLLSGSVRV
jgi:hypothetical protein